MGPTSIAERLADNSVPEPNTGCVLWLGGVNESGYGVMSVNGRREYAHRLAYKEAYGTIAGGLCVCHKCDQPSCIRPDHLFAGSRAENMHDMDAKGRRRPPPHKTHCPSGHELSGDNLQVYGPRKTFRRCAECSRVAMLKYRGSLPPDAQSAACHAWRALRTPEKKAADKVAARMREAERRKRQKAERTMAAATAGDNAPYQEWRNGEWYP